MLTRDDLIDLLVAGLNGPAAAPSPPPAGKGPARPRGLPPPGPAGRPFLTERDIKKRLTGGGKRLTIPKNSILSPLALEWLTLEGIEIARE
jgi:hypothetical protein